MLLRQIKYFVTVVECNSFTQAAEKCFISQSAISQQIGALEKVNGVVLGTFSQIERENNRKILEKIVLDMTLEYDYPVVTTPHIGHGDDSKCIIIGKEYEFKK